MLAESRSRYYKKITFYLNGGEPQGSERKAHKERQPRNKKHGETYVFQMLTVGRKFYKVNLSDPSYTTLTCRHHFHLTDEETEAVQPAGGHGRNKVIQIQGCVTLNPCSFYYKVDRGLEGEKNHISQCRGIIYGVASKAYKQVSKSASWRLYQTFSVT